ncbi:hypothetical protein OG352_22990 [Streptomyces sp. NBC_01485]|uniref:sigma factor-like helix-turn-helix DNA-binding protein n=1 Tax=Streptomyces sp. NBC_01485 TaxID=2903884 RepID=UPI002E323D4E|nr:sigma factor-like helix-turn-helix DNA-binding protein [Streptomyces sp. NBC_01485]
MNTSLRIHRPRPRTDFAAYAQAGWPRLVTTAHLLSGDPREATELVRDTLVGVYARWRRIPRDDVDFYVRRSLVKDHLRRARRQRALPHGALGALSARQRAVLVMLHWEGLGEREIAQVLGCSAGAVRSHAQRGLAVCGGDAERLRVLFAEAAESAERAEGVEGSHGAYGVVVPPATPLTVPPAAPLGVIERRGRALRRRRIGAVVAGCALLLVPSAVFAVGRFGGGGSADGSDAGTAGGAPSSPVRIVAPGERVEAVPGVQVWLTADGKHWSTPQRPNQFRGRDEDGAEDGAEEARKGSAGSGKPGVSVQMEPVTRSAFFLSGLYHGLAGDPARVEIAVGDSKVTGTVLTLAGGPGWGVWYAPAPLPVEELKASLAEDVPTVTVRDAAGKVVARSGDVSGTDVGVDVGG